MSAHLLTNFKDWKYCLDYFDWFDEQGNQLCNYLAPDDLLKLLLENTDIENE